MITGSIVNEKKGWTLDEHVHIPPRLCIAIKKFLLERRVKQYGDIKKIVEVFFYKRDRYNTQTFRHTTIPTTEILCRTVPCKKDVNEVLYNFWNIQDEIKRWICNLPNFRVVEINNYNMFEDQLLFIENCKIDEFLGSKMFLYPGNQLNLFYNAEYSSDIKNTVFK